MEIKLSNKFKKFAKEKNIVAIAIKYGKSCSSWAGSFKVPLVLREKPKDVRNYKYHLVDEIEVYVHKTVKTTKEKRLELNVVGFLMLKEIDIKGMDFTM